MYESEVKKFLLTKKGLSCFTTIIFPPAQEKFDDGVNI